MTAGFVAWLERRRLRYKSRPTVPFHQVRERLNTGDILLFHKTTRSNAFDVLELDVVSPLIFESSEFRHSGVVLRDDDGSLSVLEATTPRHSGYELASYPTGGRGIRRVPLEPLLAVYNRDNGEPHYGVRFISRPLASERVLEKLAEYRPTEYLQMGRAVPLLASRTLPAPLREPLLRAFDHQMTCAEFVHNILNRCGALADYPSKLVWPYLFESDRSFARLDRSGFSPIERFTYDAGSPRAPGQSPMTRSRRVEPLPPATKPASR